MAARRPIDKPAFLKALLVHVLLVVAIGFSFHVSHATITPTVTPQHVKAMLVERPKSEVKSKRKAQDKVKAKPKQAKKKSIKKPAPKKSIKPVPKVTPKKPKVPEKKVKPVVRPKPKPKPQVKPKVEKKPPVKKSSSPPVKPSLKDDDSFDDLLASEAKKIEGEKTKTTQKAVDLKAQEEAERKARAREDFVVSEVKTYSDLISQTTRRYWNRPPSARNGMQVVLKIRLLPGGELNSVSISRSSGNAAFDRAAVNAVERAGNFSVPSDADIFDKHFREFSMLFDPEDLKY